MLEQFTWVTPGMDSPRLKECIWIILY